MISRVGDWISARVDDEVMMMSPELGKFIGLTATGTHIWELLDEPRTAEYLCDHLCQEYDIEPAACRAEVGRFIVEMEKHGVLVSTVS